MANLDRVEIPNRVLDCILDKNFNLYRENKKTRKELFNLNNIFEGSKYDDYWTTGFVQRLLEHDAKFKMLTDEDLGIETENPFAKLKNYDGIDETDDDSGFECEGETPKPFGSSSLDLTAFIGNMNWDFRMRRYFAGVDLLVIDGNKFCNLCGTHLYPHETKKHRKTCFISEQDFDFECWNNFWKDYTCVGHPWRSRDFRDSQDRRYRRKCETGMEIQQEQAGVEGMGISGNEQPGQVGLISTEMIDQEDSTTIIDPSVGATMTHPSKLLNTIDQSVNIDSTLTTRLDRITLVKNAVITSDTIGSIIFSLPFPKVLLDSPAFYGKNIVSLHEYYSCKRLIFTLQIPAELQLVGQIQLNWYPGITGAKGSYYLESWDPIRDNTVDAFSQILDIGNENTIVLDVPVSSPLNSLVVGRINDPLKVFDTNEQTMYNDDLWQNYGTLECRVFNEIRGTEDVGDLSYSLYCRAVDTEVQFQTLERDVTYSNTIKEQGAVVGIAAAVGTAAASAAAAAAPAAGAAIGTAVVGAATTGIVSAIGKNCTVQKTITNDLGTLNASAIHDERPSYVVGLRTGDVETTENETSGLMESTQDITKMRSRIKTLNWLSTSKTGTLLMANEKIHPAMLYRSFNPEEGSTDSPRLCMSNLSFVNQFFRLYRGSIDLEIEVVGNALTRGTLGIVVTPPNASDISSANVIQNLGNYAVTNFNLQTTRRLKVNVPFNSMRQWNRCPRIHPGIPDGWKTEVYEILGHLNLIVINPLRIAPISSVNNVDINIYISSQDMEFYSAIERSDLSFTNYWYNNKDAPLPNKALEAVEQGLSDKLTAEVNILGSTSGLKPPSFNEQDHSDLIALTTQRSPYDSIALKTQYTKIKIPLPFAYLKKYSNIDPDNKCCYIDSTLMSALMQCFTWWKGNINLTIMNPQASGTSMTIAMRANYAVNVDTSRNLLVYESSFSEFSSLTESDNSIIQNFSLNQTNTFSFPWYNNNNCLPSQLIFNNLTNIDGTAEYPSPTYYPYCEVTMIVKTDSLDDNVPYIVLAQSAGPGFTLNDFIGCPSVYYGKDYDIPFLLNSQQRSGPRENNIIPPVPTKIGDNIKFSFGRDFPIRHRLVDCTDGDDQVIHEEQMFGLGKDVTGKVNVVLDSMESTSDGLNDMVRNLEPKLVSLTDNFSNLVNGDLNLTLGRVNETLKGVKESTEKITEDFKGTTENANRAIEELSFRLNDILDIVKRKISPSKSEHSLSGVATEATEKEIMASLIKCGYDKSIIPFIDQLLCELFEVVNGYIPKDGWHWTWVFAVLSPLTHKYFPNARFNHKIIAEGVHRGLDKIKDNIMSEQSGFEFDKDLSGVISIILATIFSLILSVSLKWGKAETLRNSLSIRDVFTFSSGVLTLSKLLETMISGLHKIYKKYVNPDLDVEVEWFRRNGDACAEMMHTYLKYKDLSFSSILNRPVAILEILSQKDFCDLFIKQTPFIIKTKFKVQELGKAANILLSMASYIKENKGGLPRPSPVSLLFYGGTGIGKTYLMQAIIPKIVSERLGKKMSTYNKNPESQYWDNYDYQDFVVFDDIGSKQDQEDLKDILLLDGNNSLGLNMASITEKGKMFLSPFLFYTTNTFHIQSSKHYTNREAVDRRLYKNAYDVVLRREFQKEDGTIDRNKVVGKTPDEVYQFTKIERKRVNGSELQPERTRACTFKQIIRDILYQYHDNLRTTPKVHETLVGEYSGMDLSDLIADEQGGVTDYFKEAFKRNLPGSLNGSSNQKQRNRGEGSNTYFAKRFNESYNYIIKMHAAWVNRELYYDDVSNCLVDSTPNKYFEANLDRLQERIKNLIMYASSCTDIDNYPPDFYRFIVKLTGLFPEMGYARQLSGGSEAGYNWILKWAEIGEEMHDSMGDFGGSTFSDKLRSNFRRGVRGLSVIWDDLNELIYDTVHGNNDLMRKFCVILDYFNVALAVVSVLLISAKFVGQLRVVKENLKEIFGFDRDPNETWMFENQLHRQRNHLKACADQDIDKRGSVRSETAKAIKDYDLEYDDKVGKRYDRYFPSNEESKMYSPEARDGTSRVRKGVRFSAAKRNPKQNISVEQNSSDIHSKVVSNLGRIINRRTQNFLYVLVVESSIILIPHHFFRSSREGDPCVIEFSEKGQRYEFSINFDNLLPITMQENLGDGIWSDPSDHDVAFYSLGFSLSGFRSLRKNFIKHDYIDRVNKQPGSRITIQESGMGLIQTVSKWNVTSAIVSITLADGDTKTVQYSDRVCTNLAGSVGMCGSPYLVKNTAYFGDDSVIMGIHQFGTNSTSGGGFVTQEMIQYAIDFFKPISRVEERVENDDTVMEWQNGYFKSDDPLYYSGIRWAKENETCLNFGKTAIRKSPLHGLFPPTHGNSVLSSFDKRLDDPKNFDYQMINKTNKPYEVKFPLTKDIINEVKKFLVDTWSKYTPIRDVGVLPIYDVVNGFDTGNSTTWTRDTGLLMNKSAGPVYNKIGKGKFPFFDEEIVDDSHFTISELKNDSYLQPRPGLKIYTPKSVLTDRIDYRLDLALKGLVPEDSFCGDSIKDELRKSSKIASGSSRVINFFQLDYMVLFAQYFGSFRLLYSDPQNAGPGLFSALACDSTQLFPLLGLDLKKCKRIFGIDYTAYDSSIPPILHEIMVDAINDWYSLYGATEEENQVRRVLWWECIHTQHIYKDVVYTDHHGLPSGVPCGMTTISNIIVNTILFALTCIRLEIPLDFLGRDIIAVFMGDDNLCGVRTSVSSYNDRLTDKFNRIEVAKTAALFGMKATMPDKSPDLTPEDRFDEITFLKSNFINNVNPNQYVPGMDKGTIQNLLTFYKPKGNADVDLNQFSVNINEALRFASLWGYEYYDHLSELLKGSSVINDYFTKDEINSLIPPHSRVYREVIGYGT